MHTRMEIPEIGVEEAKRRLDGGQGYVYLDVRTVPEFAAGHPPGALNVPIVLLDPTTGQMVLNETFVQVVEANVTKDARLVVGCRTGQRSETASHMLLQAGYVDVANVAGGFAGITDADGQVVVEGWSTLPFPIERGAGGERSYDSLRHGSIAAP